MVKYTFLSLVTGKKTKQASRLRFNSFGAALPEERERKYQEREDKLLEKKLELLEAEKKLALANTDLVKKQIEEIDARIQQGQ